MALGTRWYVKECLTCPHALFAKVLQPESQWDGNFELIQSFYDSLPLKSLHSYTHIRDRKSQIKRDSLKNQHWNFALAFFGNLFEIFMH